jgi:hypothetical protein
MSKSIERKNDASAQKMLVFESAESLSNYVSNLKNEDTPIKAKLNINGKEREIELRRHSNPDGSKGGWVGANVRLDNTTIAKSAVVYGDIELKDCKIGSHCTIVSFGSRKKNASDDDNNYIENSQIDKNVTLIAHGKNSVITVIHSKIESGTSIDVGEGKLLVFISHIKSNVTSATENGAQLDRLTILDIEQTEIGNDSTIVLDKNPPRMDILNKKIPSNSEIRPDPNNYAYPFNYGERVTNGGYGIRIPQPTDGILSKFITDAETYATKNTLSDGTKQQLIKFVGNKATAEKLLKVILLANYVHNNIQYDLHGYEKIVTKYNDNVEDIPLDHFIKYKKRSIFGKNGTGVCFEYALITCMILKKELAEGKSSAAPLFVGGTAMSSNSNALHAWVEVEIDGRTFVIDPTNPLPYMIAGERDKNHAFIQFMGVSDYDYTYDSQPVIKAKPPKSSLSKLLRLLGQPQPK